MYRKRSGKKFGFFIFVLFISFCLIAFYSIFISFHGDSKKSVEADSVYNPLPPDSPTRQTLDEKDANSNSLGKIIKTDLANKKGNYAVVVKNLKTNEYYSYNESKMFETGSLYKLWVMATVYSQIQNNLLNEDDVLSEDVSVLNDKFKIASDSAEKTEGTITLSVADALNQMITFSDNYAALLLSEKIGLSKVSAFLSQNGFEYSKVAASGGLPTSNAYDIAVFFEKLYKGELADENFTNEMIDLLKEQRLNNKIPKYFPDHVIVAHKTGELDDFTHDAGIVYMANGDYIIVVFSESDSPDVAEDVIAKTSEDVYNYFSAKSDLSL